jgi:glycosyltransferase involved in cell wall biosynthesis
VSVLLSINNYYYRRGGAEVVFLEQGRLFEQVGWQVVPFAMQHQKNLDSPWSAFFPEEIEFGNTYSGWEKIVRAGRVVYSRDAQQKLTRLLDRVRPSVAHAHNVYHHLSPAIFPVLKARRIPVVLTLHDLKLACPAYKMLTDEGKLCEQCKGGALINVVKNRCIKGSLALSSLIYLEAKVHRWLGLYEKYVDRFVVPSRFYIDKFVEWGWPRERFVHIPNFVDCDRISPNYTPGKRFVYVGRLSPEKGLPTLIAAAASAGVGVTLVGTGPQQQQLLAQAAATKADVTFAGHLSGAALDEAISSARAVILPSEWYENAPLSITEAYAYGKPVIGARIGGIPELIQEQRTGVTFQSGSVDDLAAKLRQFADCSDDVLSDMGRVGRAWVLSDFTATRYRERVAALYATLGVA